MEIYCCPQWNIERGYKLDAIIEELRASNADVIALQEVDIGCERSGGQDTGARPAPSFLKDLLFYRTRRT